MNILINASNLKAGGGLQVADSICRELNRFTQHRFVVVLSSYLHNLHRGIGSYENVRIFDYNIRNSVETLVFGRDKFLDGLVKSERVDVVLTVFGPSRWEPLVPHLCGFAMAFHVIPESPYYQRMGTLNLLKSKIHNIVYEFFFKRTTKYYYTENPYITKRLKTLFKNSVVYTVTNFYNQVFDQKEQWVYKKIPAFDGVTLLNISNSYPHKNLEIAIDVAKILKKEHSGFKFRFVFTIKKEQYPVLDNDLKDCFLFLGSVDVTECPSLYEQSDIVFQPTLIECFTAAYPEAMRMEKPIITTDLEFAHGLCGDAACYYSAIDPEAAAKGIYKVACDEGFRRQLVANGKERLKQFDNYEQRAEKLIRILEELAK